ncbi:MAG: hypothetical protein J6Y28_01680 [Acholeplasmatales bacterium]|nr:hypothetical protein [Methanobrevibacter sp.]MBP5444857.1 hypothetical protein [Acholeplasmatales bacterium]
MKVFSIKPHKEYSGGIALIAANTQEEAKNLYISADEFNECLYDEYNCDTQLVEGLYYESNEVFILDTIYVE